MLVPPQSAQNKREHTRCHAEGKTIKRGSQHTTGTPRGVVGDQGGWLGNAIDQDICQGPHIVRCVTAMPTGGRESSKMQHARFCRHLGRLNPAMRVSTRIIAPALYPNNAI